MAGQRRPGDFYRLGPGLAARNRTVPVSFVAFDVLAVDGELVTGRSYQDRRLRACIEAGLEGLVLKRLDSRYEAGKRSRVGGG